MRISPFLLFLINRPVDGLNRLNLFRQHHAARSQITISPQTTALSRPMNRLQNKLLGLKRVCSAKTCSKCLKLLNSPSQKFQKSCKIMVRMRACCPQKVFLPNGF